jgi:DNA-binding NarL/FixJ family response regulator
MIKVLVVDDHAFVREGLRGILDGTDGIEVVGECSDGDQVSAATATLHPDVVLMDVVMPVLSGIDATRALAAEQRTVRVLMVTGFMTQAALADAFEAGAVGFLLKGDSDGLVRAVRTVAAGGTVWPDPHNRPSTN